MSGKRAEIQGSPISLSRKRISSPQLSAIANSLSDPLLPPRMASNSKPA